MASTGLNFQNLTPDNGAVRDLRKLIFLSVLGADQIGALVNFLPKQKHGEKVGFVGEFGLIGKASSKCNPVFGNDIIATSEKTWDIPEWEVAEKICYADLEGTLAQVGMKTKTDIADLTGTEYIDYVLMPRLELAIRKMLLRFVWFGDKAAKVVADGGILKPGTDVSKFTVTDGLWKRLFAIVAADIQVDELDDDLIEDAPLVLRQSEGKVIYITQAFKDALDRDIKQNNKGSELQWESLFDGIAKSKYNGIDIVVIPFWDEIIQGYEATANVGQYNKPFRALFSVKDNLLAGAESENEIADLKIWFNIDEQLNKILAKDKIGTLIAQDDLVQVAY